MSCHDAALHKEPTVPSMCQKLMRDFGLAPALYQALPISRWVATPCSTICLRRGPATARFAALPNPPYLFGELMNLKREHEYKPVLGCAHQWLQHVLRSLAKASGLSRVKSTGEAGRWRQYGDRSHHQVTARTTESSCGLQCQHLLEASRRTTSMVIAPSNTRPFGTSL